MRLARRALVAALATLMLCAVVSAQTLRNENDPRNIAPTVGTGGPPGGPTGLFTVYDGQTLRKGEFTFSIAYSNYDRDPGDADIVEVPVSFQVGLSDHLELFFNTDAYRGIRVRSPANLSGFYLPNTRLLGNGDCSSPAIIFAPVGGNIGTIGAGTSVFRPQCTAPFVNFPFFGGNAGTFNQGGIGDVFQGFPGFLALIGNPVASSNGGNNFGPADSFPGLGSPVGSILPGVVLATQILQPNLVFGPNLRVPVTFTVWPTYLPDAPFLGREYGESSFNTFVVGAKWRFTGPTNPFGVALIPFYRFYADSGDTAGGFRNLQRGASPGGNIGDFGFIFVVDGRLSRSANLSANIGFILNSNPKGPGDSVLLDRPNEFLGGVGFDFPINKHFQVIAEVRSTAYVGGHTLNAFQNSPVDALAGLRVFPRRWWGFGAAYRYHLNQQNRDLFNPKQAEKSIGPFNVTIPAPGPGFTTFTVPAQTFLSTTGAFPTNFRPSDDANGFIFQFWVGKRNPRAPEYLPNQPPTVTLTASASTITLPCPPGLISETCTPSSSTQVQLSANATDPDGDTLLYTYSTTGGRITGEGPNVTWDLTGATAGTYTATVEVDDGCGCVAFSSTTVTIADCTGCHPPCPTVTVDCPTGITDEGTPVTFTANVSGGSTTVTATYNWSVSAGTITSGQGTPSITVDTTGLGGQTVTGTVQVGGYPPECQTTASCSAQIGRKPVCRKFDEYGNIPFNDEKARLDNFAIQLQNEPGSQGYIVAYGSCGGEGQRRADRAKDYLVTTRGIDAGRITVIASDQCTDALTVQLWICPTGAPAPTLDTAGTHPCVDCRPTGGRRRGGARRRGRRGREE